MLHCRYPRFFLSVIGLVAVFNFHQHQKFPDLYSLHSWFGLITVIFFGLNMTTGFISFLFPKLREPIRAWLKPNHIKIGLWLYIMQLATSSLGIMESITFDQFTAPAISHYGGEAMLANSIGVLIYLLIGLVLFALLPTPQGPPPIDNHSAGMEHDHDNSEDSQSSYHN